MGTGGIRNQLKKQKMTNYYDLYLNSETARYVYRIIALKILMENPEKYGFNFREQDLYQPIPYTELEIDTTINNIAEFAVAQESSYKYIKMLNPWLRSNELPNASGKKYTIKIPRKDLLKLENIKYLEDSTNTPDEFPE